MLSQSVRGGRIDGDFSDFCREREFSVRFLQNSNSSCFEMGLIPTQFG
jgi:hypothetical protein